MSPYQRLAEQARLVCTSAQDEMPSPCISLCRMSSASGLCLGCLRTMDEIAGWGRMEEGAKLEVWRSIGARIEQALNPACSRREREEDT